MEQDHTDASTPAAQATHDDRTRLEGVVDAGRNRIANQLEQIGDRIESRADELGDTGAGRHAGDAARRTSAALDSGADYIRTHEPAEMRDDLEAAIRTRPLMAVGIALGAGFLLGSLLRE